jgi:hypothetical protein
MSLEQLWQAYHHKGYESIKTLPTDNALGTFYFAILAFREQDIEHAVNYAQQTKEQEPNNLVFSQAVTYLKSILKTGTKNVYGDDRGFAAFIRGGGNISLYQKTSVALRSIYQEYETFSLLDIGVGDGMAILPALTDNIHHLDLLEPSEVMLNKLCTILDRRGRHYQATCSTLQDFIHGNFDNWDVIQATFSLQSLSPEEHPVILEWIRKHGKRFLMVEFDTPNFGSMIEPESVQYIIDHYQNGLSEYDVDRDLVAQGFLMPVMFGYFDQTANRTNYEQPIQEWVNELQAVGFKNVNVRVIYPYWWASAYLIDAC